MKSLSRVCVFVLAAGLLAATPLHAATYDWTTGGTRVFYDVNNWSPIAGSWDQTGDYNVNFDDPLSPQIGSGDNIIINSATIGGASGSTGRLDVSGGTLAAATTFGVGNNGATGTLVMTGGTISAAANDCWVGVGGNATMDFQGASQFNMSTSGVGNRNTFGYGGGYSATVTMQDTASITSGTDFHLGDAGGIGSITMGRVGFAADAPTLSLNAPGDNASFEVGVGGGTGTLTINDNASVFVNGNMTVGGGGGTGNVVMNGGTFTQKDYDVNRIIVGDGGAGSFVMNGGVATIKEMWVGTSGTTSYLKILGNSKATFLGGWTCFASASITAPVRPLWARWISATAVIRRP